MQNEKTPWAEFVAYDLFGNEYNCKYPQTKTFTGLILKDMPHRTNLLSSMTSASTNTELHSTMMATTMKQNSRMTLCPL